MTMQIAIRARDGFVLASDRKTRENGNDPRTPLLVTGESKVCKCEKHDIVIAFSGAIFGKKDEEPQLALRDELDRLEEVNPDEIKKWADGYVKEQFPSEVASPEDHFTAFRLLIADAGLKFNPFSILDIRYPASKISSTQGWPAITGDAMNSSVFWPSYFDCYGKQHNLNEVIDIAALTVLMGHKFNTDGVAGLEVWKFKDGGKWEQVPESQIEVLEERYAELEEFLDSFLRRD